MGFLKAFQKITKATVDIAVTPVEAVKDFVTLGGVLTDQDKPYTVQRLEKAAERTVEAYEAIDEE